MGPDEMVKQFQECCKNKKQTLDNNPPQATAHIMATHEPLHCASN